MISGLLFVNTKGEHIISRFYRDDVRYVGAAHGGALVVASLLFFRWHTLLDTWFFRLCTAGKPPRCLKPQSSMPPTTNKPVAHPCVTSTMTRIVTFGTKTCMSSPSHGKMPMWVRWLKQFVSGGTAVCAHLLVAMCRSHVGAISLPTCGGV